MTPITSNNPIINGIFNACVWLLMLIGSVTGLSYNTVNVLVFCVIWPILTIVLFIYAWRKVKPNGPRSND